MHRWRPNGLAAPYEAVGVTAFHGAGPSWGRHMGLACTHPGPLLCPSNAMGMKTPGSTLRSPPSFKIHPMSSWKRQCGGVGAYRAISPPGPVGPPPPRKGTRIFHEKPPLSAPGPVATPGPPGQQDCGLEVAVGLSEKGAAFSQC